MSWKTWAILLAVLFVITGCKEETPQPNADQTLEAERVPEDAKEEQNPNVDDEANQTLTNTSKTQSSGSADSKENQEKAEQSTKHETKTETIAPTHEFARVKVPLASPVDGDTVKVIYNGKEESVRFLLIDTPETNHPRLGKQPFGEEAKAFTTSMVQNAASLELEFDIGQKRDKYDRLLAYIYADGKSIQEELVKKGLARVAYVYPPNTRYVDPYQALQREAQKKGVGIWSIENYVQEDGYQKEVTEPKEAVEKEPKTSDYSGKYDPNGPDRDCSDFDTHKEAQAFFTAAGGPDRDPHRLDGTDNDGLACESLP